MEKFVFVETDEIIDHDICNGVVRLEDGREVRAARIRILEYADTPVYWYESDTVAAVKSYAAIARAQDGRTGEEWAEVWHNRPA